MDKRTFLDGLRSALVSLPAAEIDKTIAYYEEMIDDRIEDGMSEEEAVASLETPEKLAERIISEAAPVEKVVRRARQSNVPTVLLVILAIIGLPIWLPLLLLLISLGVGLFALLFGVIIALIGIIFALAIGGIWFMAFSLIHIDVSGMSALLAVGLGLIGIGLGILLFFPVTYLIKALWRGIKALAAKTSALFKGRR